MVNSFFFLLTFSFRLMQVASCGNVTTGAESKSRALGMRTLVRYSCSEKEPKRKK